MSRVMLYDGRGFSVARNSRAILSALSHTDMVEIDGWPIHIMNFYSDLGDEVDVYDGRKTYDPQEVFEPSESQDAATRFLEIVFELEAN